MKHTQLISLLICLVGFSFLAQAQQTRKIEFNETTHDFGEIEHSAPTETVFTFTNNSDKPVTLDNVRASCGCTTPKWTKDEVAPGATGEIQVKYNSHRQGKFTKAVTVMYDSDEKPIVLYIKGNVNPPAPKESDIYSMPQGAFSFDRIDVNLGSFNSDQDQSVEFLVKNTSDKPLTIQGTESKPGMIKEVKPSMYVLQPGDKGTVKVTIDGSYFDATETFSTEVKIKTDDTILPEKILKVSGRVNRVYSAEELAKMPNLQFERTTYVGGDVIEGEELKITYPFTNTGGSDLIVESVKGSCGCTVPAIADKVVKPGETSEITATFYSKGRPGKQVKSITVRSNDPDAGTIVLRLECEVQRDPFHQNSGATPVAQPRK